MSTEYNAVTGVRQQKSLREIKRDFRQSLINYFSVCDLRNRAYEIGRSMVILHSRTKQRDIPRSYSAITTNSHVQTVTRATNFLESIGLFSVVRGYKKVNKYIFNHLDVLEEFFGLSVGFKHMCARLFISKLYNNLNLVSKCSKKSEFGINPIAEKNQEIGKVCFSPITGVYIPLELRPFDNTIEVSREDRASLVGVRYQAQMFDFVKYELNFNNTEDILRRNVEVQAEAKRQRARKPEPKPLSQEILDWLNTQ